MRKNAQSLLSALTLAPQIEFDFCFDHTETIFRSNSESLMFLKIFNVII